MERDRIASFQQQRRIEGSYFLRDDLQAMAFSRQSPFGEHGDALLEGLDAPLAADDLLPDTAQDATEETVYPRFLTGLDHGEEPWDGCLEG